MQYLSCFYAILFIALMLFGCSNEAPLSSESVELDKESAFFAGDQISLSKHRGILSRQRAELFAFQPAGDVGGGVLEPGTFFPPVRKGVSKLFRGSDWLGYEIRTDGLPPGAYTNWWVIVNNPEECDGDCDEGDIFGNPETNSSVFWATGGIVKKNGVGKFQAKIHEGQPSKGPDGFLFGNGLENAKNAEVHLIVKYHGLASDDPDELYLQTRYLTGLCEEGANAYDLGPPFGIQCFDPQAVIHR